MKRSFSIILLSLLMTVSGCITDVSRLQDDVANLQQRVTALELLCSQMNTNISSLQSIADAAQNGNYITSVTPVTNNGEIVGYTIAFVKGEPITIYNGTNGTNGTDGHTPTIGIKADADGVFYWTVDNDWLLDASGQKVKAVGTDGRDGNDGNDGANGANGIDGVTPQLKIENGYWYVSTDKAQTWTKLGKATGENGADGDSMFTQIDTSSDDYVLFSLSNGTTIKVPTWSAFDRLSILCNQMNSNLEGISEILEALKDAKYVKSVVSIMENDKEIGYALVLSDNTTIKLYHGKEGSSAQDGENGNTPSVGVRQDTDQVWYWTIKGEWLLDANGQKVKAVGGGVADGAGSVTPRLKIENDYWYVSIDKGKTWMQFGKATGDLFFKSITEDDGYVYLTFTNDTVLKLPKSSVLEITFDPADIISMLIGVPLDITYTVTSSLTPVRVQVMTSSDIRAKVTPADTDGLAGTITVVAQGAIGAFSQILVMVDNGEKVLTRAFSTENGGLSNDTTGQINGYEWVDLGLPSGLKWATCNVGTSRPEEYGDYFAWGETEPYYSSQSPLTWKPGKSAGYEDASYKYHSASSSMTKYNEADNKTTLELDDDAAHANWGDGWRMPTDEEWTELMSNCTWTWLTQDGVNGMLVTSNTNGSSIFLPAAGDRSRTDFNDTGEGRYWSSSVVTFEPYDSWAFLMRSTSFSLTRYQGRSRGCSVRPVID